MSSSPRQPPVIFLMGPTASGKTALAVELVRRLPCDIVSVDSAMVYRGMDIGTAKPGPEILCEAPHRLIDLLDPAESYSVGRFCTDARREIAAIRTAGRIPLLVGGTMLYFHALQRGIAALPGADAAVRARIEAQARVCGWAALHRRLAEIDPAAARRIHPNDPQRIQRALEVHALTGVSLTELQGRPNAPTLGVPVVKLALAPSERAVLHRDIERRFRGMLQAGLTDEVRRLRRRGDLDLGRPALRAVGYRQVWAYLEGRIDHEAMVVRAVIATRQLAKRQLTWLRVQTDALWLDSLAPDLLNKALKALSKKKHSGVAPGSGMLHFCRPCDDHDGECTMPIQDDKRRTHMARGQSLQEPFLNALRKSRVPVAIYLVNGIKLQGQIESFDQFVVLLKNSVSQMVYKHAISTVVPSRNIKFATSDDNNASEPGNV